ncbi:MAG: Rpn family recombination-promoting nuclease/putative transposase [Prevotellaceae bacterium]|jgi:predicted transposase/invertase (TIGR01784 family)|nr:Rpn family recombination-promoting nuclease/putative transposase [Prevotellaceae bacterium]
MAHYLDPKNDFIFKRIFGNHPDLLISFLNALLPFGKERIIKNIKYISNELVPDNLLKKFSLVDVRCTDNFEHQFIVEMQIEWSSAFSNMLFMRSNICVQQMDCSDDYASFSPVYALSIHNENFDHQTPEFYHRYRVSSRENTDEMVESIELVMVELPKLKAERWSDRKMAVLWLRFLKEMKERVTDISQDLLANMCIRKAIEICEKGGFTSEELALYDKYWDAIRTEKSVIKESFEKGFKKGLKEAREEARKKAHEEGLKEGLKEGERQKTIQTILNCAKESMTVELIAKVTGLSVEEITDTLENGLTNKLKRL